MSWIAVAAVVGTGIQGARASSKAAGIAAEGAERSGAQIQAAGDLARRDVQRIFPQAQGDLISGAAGAADILGQGISEQQRLFSAGNVGAQQTLGQGFGNIQAALLGTPINQQAFAPQSIELSQPIANPIGQTLGGGQVEGGLFSNLAQTTEENKASEITESDIARLIARAQGNDSAAIEGLRLRGFDKRGNQLPDELLLKTKHTPEVLRLIDRARNAGGQSASEAINGLRIRGFDQRGNPLGNT